MLKVVVFNPSAVVGQKQTNKQDPNKQKTKQETITKNSLQET